MRGDTPIRGECKEKRQLEPSFRRRWDLVLDLRPANRQVRAMNQATTDTLSRNQRAFVFPGQGSQAIGMGKDLAESFPAAKAVFDQVDEALGQNLSALMWDGDLGELTLTQNAQPALMAVSLAAVRALESEGYSLADQGAFVAGHSLGEYSALAAAGVLDISDCAKLLRLRGQSMQAAVPVGEGAMAAVLGLTKEQVEDIADEAAQATGLICALANDNAPGQGVMSGAAVAIDKAIELASAAGAKRALKLNVSAPFHCDLMAPAATAMAEALAAAEMKAFALPLIANVKAQAVDQADQARELLVQQVTGRVRWSESMSFAADQGVIQLVEVGAGKVLSGLAKRIDPRLSAVQAGTVETIKALLNS